MTQRAKERDAKKIVSCMRKDVVEPMYVLPVLKKIDTAAGDRLTVSLPSKNHDLPNPSSFQHGDLDLPGLW